MIRVLHIFKKEAEFRKSDYTPEARKLFFEWGNQLVSRLGKIKDQRLFLPNEYKEQINVSRTGTVIIQDIIGFSGTSAKKDYLKYVKEMDFPSWFADNWTKRFPEIIHFNKQDSKLDFDPFTIDIYNKELYLKDAYKLCGLKVGEPVRILLNKKCDFSFSGRRERTYLESDYIFQYLGEVDKIEFLSEEKLEVQREIPLKTAKLIDLRTTYY